MYHGAQDGLAEWGQDDPYSFLRPAQGINQLYAPIPRMAGLKHRYVLMPDLHVRTIAVDEHPPKPQYAHQRRSSLDDYAIGRRSPAASIDAQKSTNEVPNQRTLKPITKQYPNQQQKRALFRLTAGEAMFKRAHATPTAKNTGSNKQRSPPVRPLPQQVQTRKVVEPRDYLNLSRWKVIPKIRADAGRG
jgi:hypothetical protein